MYACMYITNVIETKLSHEGRALAESVWREVTGETSTNSGPDVQVSTEESFSQEGPEAIAVKTEKIVKKTTMSDGLEQTEEIVREMKNVESAVTNVEGGLPTETKQTTDSFREVVTTEVRPSEPDGTVVRTTNTVTVERVQGTRTTTINLDEMTPEQLEQLLRDRGAEGLLTEPPGTEIVHEEGSRAYDVHEGSDVIVQPKTSSPVAERATYPPENEDVSLEDKINEPVADVPEEILSATVTSDVALSSNSSVIEPVQAEVNPSKEEQSSPVDNKSDKSKSPKSKPRGLFSLFKRRSSVEDAKKKEREEEKRTATLEKKNKKKKEKEDKQKEKATKHNAKEPTTKVPTVVVSADISTPQSLDNDRENERFEERGIDVPLTAPLTAAQPRQADHATDQLFSSSKEESVPLQQEANHNNVNSKVPVGQQLELSISSSDERVSAPPSGLPSPKSSEGASDHASHGDHASVAPSRPDSIAIDDHKHGGMASTPLSKGGTSPMSNETLDGALAANSSSFIENCWPIDEASPIGHFVVVAIDFGTTFSGYAFSFTRDPDSIHMMRKWEGGDPGVINQKTPTTLLLTPDGKFHSFGFHARDFFHDLDAQESKKWHYFEKFKMMLHYNAVSFFLT